MERKLTLRRNPLSCWLIFSQPVDTAKDPKIHFLLPQKPVSTIKIPETHVAARFLRSPQRAYRMFSFG
jgi:hypothetical protein